MPLENVHTKNTKNDGGTTMQHRKLLSPFRLIILAYALLIFLGGTVLYLPLSHRPEVDLTFMDALFTAASAVTVTGLTVVTPSEAFSPFGLIVLSLLIQLGGIGIMSLGTVIWLVTGQKINLSQRILIMVDQNQFKISGLVSLIKNILILVLVIELAGAILLSFRYLAYFDSFGEALIHGAFASLSAFTNSGFDLTGRSLQPFAQDFFILAVTVLLIVAGAIGFPVLVEVKEYLSSKKKGYRFSLFTKVAASTYLLLVILGGIIIWLLEGENSFSKHSGLEGILYALFYSVTSRSAGLSISDVAHFQESTLFFLSGLMIIGASPSSAGGGIRTTTLAVMLLAIFSFARGRREVRLFGRELHQDDIRRAFVVLSLFVVLWFTAVVLIASCEKEIPFVDLLFEVSSAFGTCGLSTGITGELSTASRWVLMFLMFTGRIGLVVLLFSLKRTDAEPRYHLPKERVIIG